MKKLSTIVALAALLLPAVPASAATTFSSPTVNVNWNTTASGSITLYADYATGSTLCGTEATGCGTPAVLTNAGAGSGACTAAPAAPTALTGAAGSSTGVFFGSIAPDLSNNNTECYYKNAVDALISTNDGSGYTLTEQATGSTNATGVWLCYAPNGALPTAGTTGSGVSAAPSGFTATGAVATCPTGMTQIPTASAATVLNTTSTVSGGHAGEDYALVVPALATAGASQFVVTYTFVGK
ncbi:MAG TPA: hypothetical protein VJP85_11135 [Candidatus Baltobacteraceae bacterium]|nr:hypothetical protein [Candidatus Baltobacteraceae bacterium]